MPTVAFGKARVSPLIVVGNSISGASHVSSQVNAEMRDYSTAATVKKLLEECERCGINTWESRAVRNISRLLNEYRIEGNSIQWIAQTVPEYGICDGTFPRSRRSGRSASSTMALRPTDTGTKAESRCP